MGDVGHVGAYYQWDNNWKVTGRAGVQSFGGAELINLTPYEKCQIRKWTAGISDDERTPFICVDGVYGADCYDRNRFAVIEMTP